LIPSVLEAAGQTHHASLETSGDDTVTIIEQGGAAVPQAVADLIKETTPRPSCRTSSRKSKRQPSADRLLAPWCGPCRQLTPIIEKAVRRAPRASQAGQDEHRRPSADSRARWAFQSIPAVIAFVNGQPATASWARCRRARSPPSSNKLTRAWPPRASRISPNLQEAEAVLAEGDPAAAAQIYAEVLVSTPPISRRWQDLRNAT